MKKLFFASLTAIALAIVLNGHAAYAASTPEGCFKFDATTESITEYYDNEADNPTNPACPRDVEIPSVIGGVVVTSIGDWAFGNSQLITLTIPDSVTSIGSYAFYNNQLTSLTIPNSVTSVGDWAFSSNQLTALTLSNSVTSISRYAFFYNQLTTFTIPGSITSIGDSAFASNQLTSLTIPNSVTSVGDWAFENNQLVNLTLGNSVTSIGKYAFSGNELTTLIIPNSVTSVGDSAFYHNQLTSLTLGNSVTSIDDGAFAYNQLRTVTLLNDDIPVTNQTFAYQSTSPTFQNDINSYDPAKFQSALDSIILVKLYTANPSNPAGLKGLLFVVDETIRQDWGCDATDPCPGDFNGDGDTDDTFVLGGYIVNPASVVTTYKDQSGAELALSVTAISSNPAVKSYFAKDVPIHIDTVNGSTAEIPNYYRLGQNATLTAPTIAGYSTISPASPHTTHLTSAENTVDFVYSNLPQPIADVIAPTTGALASTGTSVWLLAGGALLLIIASILVIIKTRRKSHTANAAHRGRK